MGHPARMMSYGAFDGAGSVIEEDWSVADRPGVKVSVGDEYIIAQILDNGFTVTWTTDDSPVEAVQKCARMGEPDMEASIRYDDSRAAVAGRDIVPFLEEHGSDCWWVKLTRRGRRDYVVYVVGEDGDYRELATLGPPLVPTSTGRSVDDRISHIREMVRVTATSGLLKELDAVLAPVLNTIAAPQTA